MCHHLRISGLAVEQVSCGKNIGTDGFVQLVVNVKYDIVSPGKIHNEESQKEDQSHQKKRAVVQECKNLL